MSFDRTEHCRRIAADGGNATLALYGPNYMRQIGRAGARVTIARHGVGYFKGLTRAKGWTGPQRSNLAMDLAYGKTLADLAA